MGSVLLGGLQVTRPYVRPTRRELALLVLAGLLWFGVYNVVLNDAERRVDAGTAAMLVLVAPIIIVALAAVFLKERTTPNLLLGGAIQMFSRPLLLFSSQPLLFSSQPLLPGCAIQLLLVPPELFGGQAAALAEQRLAVKVQPDLQHLPLTGDERRALAGDLRRCPWHAPSI